jgi:hypothetical protein
MEKALESCSKQIYNNVCNLHVLKTIVEFQVKVKQQILCHRYIFLPNKASMALRAQLKQKKAKDREKRSRLQANFENPTVVSECLSKIVNTDNSEEVLSQLSGQELRFLLLSLELPSHNGKAKLLQIRQLRGYFDTKPNFTILQPEKLKLMKSKPGNN